MLHGDCDQIIPSYNLLDVKDQQLFIEQYAKLVSEDYPIREDGKTIFPFKRLFIVSLYLKSKNKPFSLIISI